MSTGSFASLPRTVRHLAVPNLCMPQDHGSAHTGNHVAAPLPKPKALTTQNAFPHCKREI